MTGYSTPNSIIGLSGMNPDSSTFDLNDAADWLAYGFVAPPSGPTLNKVLVYCYSVVGTLTALQCDIYDSAAGLPNSQVATTSTLTALPTGAQWFEFTGLSYATTGGKQYWVVLKNTTGTPASNYPRMRFSLSISPFFITNTLTTNRGVASADSGSTWAAMTVRPATCGMRLEYADGYAHLPLSNRTSSSSGTGMYDKREQGAKFTTPAAGQLVVGGIAATISKTGTPPKALRFRLYSGNTLVATTKTIEEADVATTSSNYAFFDSAITLSASTEYRIVGGVAYTGSSDGDTSNYYRIYSCTIHDADASRDLLPLGGWMHTYTADSSDLTTYPWSDTATECPWIALILDSDSTPITAAGGGGGARIIGG